MQDGKLVHEMGKRMVQLAWITASACRDGSKDAEIPSYKRLL